MHQKQGTVDGRTPTPINMMKYLPFVALEVPYIYMYICMKIAQMSEPLSSSFSYPHIQGEVEGPWVARFEVRHDQSDLDTR